MKKKWKGWAMVDKDRITNGYNQIYMIYRYKKNAKAMGLIYKIERVTITVDGG